MLVTQRVGMCPIHSATVCVGPKGRREEKNRRGKERLLESAKQNIEIPNLAISQWQQMEITTDLGVVPLDIPNCINSVH